MTVQRPNKIVAQKGIKQVCAVLSAERGRLVTVAVVINNHGGHIPPFFVFPLKRYQDHMIGVLVLEILPAGGKEQCF